MKNYFEVLYSQRSAAKRRRSRDFKAYVSMFKIQHKRTQAKTLNMQTF